MNKLLFLLFLLPSFLLCQSKVSISPIVSSLKFSNKSRVNISGYILNDIAKVSDEIIFGVDIGYNYSHSISTHCTFTIPASSIIGGIGNFEGNTIGNINYLMTMISLQYKLNSWRGVHFDIGSGMNNIRIINGSQAILDQLLNSSFYIPFLKVGTSVGLKNRVKLVMEIRKLFGSTTNISGAISSETPQLNGQYVEAEMDLKPNILSFGISVNL